MLKQESKAEKETEVKYIKKVEPVVKAKGLTGTKNHQESERPKDDRPGCVPVSGD